MDDGMKRWLRSACAAALLFTGLIPFPAAAQSYPVKPIRMIVPYPPGGIDVFVRAIGPRVSEMLGQPVVMDNRGGANGFIGTGLLARAEPDGYTIGFISSATVVGGPILSQNAPFDPIKDLTPVIGVVETTLLLTVSQATPVGSAKELIEYARSHPGKLSFASSGVGSAFHLNGEKLNLLAGINIVHVPYKGSGPMATDLVAGRIEVGFPALNNVRAHLSSGKIKVLAVMTRKRSPDLPDVPAIGEALPGFPPQTPFAGVYAPARLPQPILGRLNGVFSKAMESPDFQKFTSKNGAIIFGGSPEDLGERLNADIKDVGDLVKRLGIEKQ